MNKRIPDSATGISRRGLMAVAAGVAASALARGAPVSAETAGSSILNRPIPHGGESLPVVGVGTSIVFDVGEDAGKRAEIRRVIETMVAGGGKLIDTAASYGSSEGVVGALVEEAGLRDKTFLASKISVRNRSASIAEMEQGRRRLRTQKIDLLQLHNVRDPNTDLALFREWKAQGIIRYTGITTSFNGDHAALAAIARREKPDFVQINYSIADRAAEKVLPTAKDAGAAVLINLPFGRGQLFRLVRGKPLPDWAAEFDAATWGQFFLKFLLAHEAVTAVIPGTAKAEHMKDNLAAGRGRLPDRALRARMAAFIDGLG